MVLDVSLSVAFALTLALTSARADLFPGGMLYPRESETREVRTLDGIWRFRTSQQDTPLKGFSDKWFAFDLDKTGDTLPMPVPASYNDITQDHKLRDHLGLVWYDRTFYVADTWKDIKRRVWMRFGSVNYAAQVWVNGELAMVHEIGHLPFQAEITPMLKFGGKNRVTVVVDNTLLQTTVPQGRIVQLQTNNGTVPMQTYTFDFFNYAGIHRSVHLYTTPVVYIDDITVETDVAGDVGIISYNVSYSGGLDGDAPPSCFVELLDKHGDAVIRDDGLGLLEGVLQVPEANLWWPYLMHSHPGYMYTLQVRLRSKEWGSEDIYRLPVGIRRLEWNNSIYINSRPLYIRGFGKHEDSDIRGKGLDLPLLVKDYNLLKWIGANCYRTSHYPYAEEMMDMADQQGILVIDESPSVDTENFSPILLQKHVDSLGELIRRDKNHPSVIMWSVANEARTHLFGAETYFRYVVDYVRNLDPTRPVTMAIARGHNEDKTAHLLDVIGFNRYNAWYSYGGRLDIIQRNIENEAQNWYLKFKKPVLMMEYGGDTMEGLHFDPPYIWSEEYQANLLSEHFKAFDNLRQKDFFIGEMIWNFADFKTAQTYTRVGGNKKGIFTRNRQPKTAAFLVRRRYMALAHELDNATITEAIDNYIISSPRTQED